MKLLTDRKALAVARIKAGLSQTELSKRANVSKTLICQIETGDRNPSPGTARKLCEALSVDFEDIFFIADGYKCEQ
jgi:DNA-binding XRE family transcriptional regulator